MTYKFNVLFGWVLVFLFPVLVNARPSTAQAQMDWPEFRGPDGSGSFKTDALPTDFSKEQIVWKIPVPGKGWSSPVVGEGKIWLSTATVDGTSMSVMCVDAQTGKTIFDKRLHENKEPAFCHPVNSYASPTPALEEGRVYVHFGQYGTTCLDTNTGETLWQRTDIKCDHFRGPGASPVLSKKYVLVAFDGIDQQFVIALNKDSGETVWRQTRNIDYGTENGDQKKAYSTGTVITTKSGEVFISPASAATVAYQVDDGQERWSAYYEGWNASARPLITDDGLIVVTNGQGKLIAVEGTGSGNVTDSHIRFLRSKGVPKKATPLLVNDRIFMINDRGIATCFSATDGSAVWATRLGGKFSSSPIHDGKKILVTSEAGKIHVFEAGDQFSPIADIDFADGFRASPAAVDGDLLLRSLTHLYRIRGNASPQKE